MDLDKLNFLPEWNDDDDNEDNEGEGWKNQEAKQAAKALYLKWRDTFSLIFAFAENLAPDPKEGEEQTHEQFTKGLILENAMIIGPKLRGAMSVDMYILKMQNAAIVRRNAIEIIEQVTYAVLSDFVGEEYENVIRESMDEFRLLFKEWVQTFKKDDIEDEWGLFN